MSEQPSPRRRYEASLTQPGMVADPAQAAAVDALQALFERLLATPPKSNWRGQRQPWPAQQGLYLWGGVGRGKTWLMDAFYDALPFRYKLRTHFHRFMLDIHARRKRYSNLQDPLAQIASDLASQVRVLCFDEFFVSDIADAMILGRLFDALFERGICLVATSNLPPGQLYRDGLQRQHFLPTIDRLQRAVQVLNVDGGIDYRLRALTRTAMYFSPADAAAESAFQTAFEALAPEAGTVGAEVVLHGRPVLTRHLADGVVWFDFAALCQGPRGVADYLEIARTHHSVLLSGVPQLGLDGEDPARRFIHLVDAFYDRNIKLMLSAAVPLESLYAGSKLNFEFARTRSRLLEMQSHEYLARPHLP